MPQPLDYVRISPQERPQVNVSAAISVACGAAAIIFMIGMCGGLWTRFLPLIGRSGGWIAGGLAFSAVVNGAIGALRAPRDSGWYQAALIGYAAGMFVGALSPIFFLL